MVSSQIIDQLGIFGEKKKLDRQINVEMDRALSYLSPHVQIHSLDWTSILKES